MKTPLFFQLMLALSATSFVYADPPGSFFNPHHHRIPDDEFDDPPRALRIRFSVEDDHHHHFDHHHHRPLTHLKLPDPIVDSDFYDNGRPPLEKVLLGRFLFFDKILSGNRNISCATCHHPDTHTSDDLSLGIGEGGSGIGRERTMGSGSNAIHERIPRNSPALFNLGAKEYKVFFHDGRVSVRRSEPSGFKSPAGRNLPTGLENPLAAQAMFPVTSGAEMAGQRGENDVANAAAAEILAGEGGVWDLLADRVREIPEYVRRFQAVYPSKIKSKYDITFVDIANSLAAYQAVAFRADESPFDMYLHGENVLHAEEERGMELFFGRANCASCHSGKFMTDHSFHAIAMPQIGPGKGDGYGGHDDFGRERVTKLTSDRYKFRTPGLRNVALTGPWGHAGQFATLEATIAHHADAVASLRSYNTKEAILPSRSDLNGLDFLVHRHSSSRIALEKRNQLPARSLSRSDIADLVAFLEALTDRYSVDLTAEIPRSVPSGLSVDR